MSHATTHLVSEADVAVATAASSFEVWFWMKRGVEASPGWDAGHSFSGDEKLVRSCQRVCVPCGHLKLARPTFGVHRHNPHAYAL